MAEEVALKGWRRLLTTRGPAVALGLAALVSLPSLWAGLSVDDYLHGLKLDRAIPQAKGDIFCFATGNPDETMPLVVNGPYPWWTWPELRFRFFRPTSVALAQLEHDVFGRATWVKHLHSIVWFLALVWVVNALYRRALEPPGAPRSPWAPVSLATGLAMFLFALDDVHWMPVSWIANRNALIATVPTLLGLLLHLRTREDGWWPGRWLALPLFALGLSGGEAALGALAYLGAYEVFGARDGLKARALALLPLAVLGAGYVALYKLTNSGAAGSGIYLDPLGQPLEFAVAAPGRMLALVGAQVLGATADLWLVFHAARPVLVAMGVLSVALVTWLLRGLWPSLSPDVRRHLRWLVLGAVLSLLPVAATFPLNRLLLMPSVGGCALVAVILAHVSWKAGAARWAAGLLVVMNVAIAPLNWFGSYFLGGVLADGQQRGAMETDLSDEALEGRVVLFVGPDPASGLYPPMVRAWNGKKIPETWLLMSLAPYAHRLTRVSPDTVELEVVGGRMLESVFEQLFRSETIPVPAGFTVQLAHAKVTVLSLDQGLPQRIALTLEAPDDPRWTFLVWRKGRFERLVLPAVGEKLELPREPGLVPIQ